MKTLVAVGFSNLSEIQNEILRTLISGINTRIGKRLKGIEVPQFPGGLVCYSYFESKPTGRQAITLRALSTYEALLIRLEVVFPDQGMGAEELLVVFSDRWEAMILRLLRYLQRRLVAPELVACVVEALRLPPLKPPSDSSRSAAHSE
jgi:hypothetical protein